MPKIKQEQPKHRRQKYPIDKWVSMIRERHQEWEDSGAKPPKPYLEIKRGSDYNTKTYSMRFQFYRYFNKAKIKNDVRIETDYANDCIRMYWVGVG